jgi:hypothetical protein
MFIAVTMKNVVFWDRVALVRTKFSDEIIVPIIRVKKYGRAGNNVRNIYQPKQVEKIFELLPTLFLARRSISA